MTSWFLFGPHLLHYECKVLISCPALAPYRDTGCVPVCLFEADLQALCCRGATYRSINCQSCLSGLVVLAQQLRAFRQKLLATSQVG